MELNKRQIIQLQFWKCFQEIEKPTFVQFIVNQPRINWFLFLVLIFFYLFSYYYYGYNGIQTGIVVGGIIVLVALYLRFRRDWVLSRYCLDWDKITKLLENE
jgi:hypothetical protein